MREKYIDLMERTLSAYSNEHIERYFNDVKTNGLTEHGFPRLTANIGILIAHGRRIDLLPLFLEMMDFCCKMFLRPYVNAANEFSVREIVCCVHEIEESKVVGPSVIENWKKDLTQIIPEACYNVLVKDEQDRITNWAIFGAVSEYARVHFGLGENFDFIDRQLSCQFQWLDENGMYRDNKTSDIHQPITYDHASRGLFALLLHLGYRGRYYDKIDACLKKAGLVTLDMQSSNGEIAFGGRSNQFLLTEGWLAAVLEFEAIRYAKEGNTKLAAAFKAAIARALAVTEQWLDKEPIRHIKNRFPAETSYGCEEYAYFDKYMITTASNLYVAYLICDDSIPTVPSADHEPAVFATTDYFHKVFLKSGDYMAEIDTNADPYYDAKGLGRVHREGAPSTICLSVPCPSCEPKYKIDLDDHIALSLCPGILKNGEWQFATDESVLYDTLDLSKDKISAFATIACRFSGNKCISSKYTVNADGVQIEVMGEDDIAYMLPAFHFDGEVYPEISFDEHCLSVSYQGWICRYTTDGRIFDTGKLAANRNGHYRVFIATSQNKLGIKIEILKL